jgi:hypothetical protein
VIIKRLFNIILFLFGYVIATQPVLKNNILGVFISDSVRALPIWIYILLKMFIGIGLCVAAVALWKGKGKDQ